MRARRIVGTMTALLLIVGGCSGGNDTDQISELEDRIAELEDQLAGSSTTSPPTTSGSPASSSTTTTAPPPAAQGIRDTFQAVTRVQGEGLGPDTAIAAGHDRIVAITNNVVAIRTKSGQVIDQMPAGAFWEEAPTAIPIGRDIADPHVTYDPYDDRFVIVEAGGFSEPDCDPCLSYQLLAVSRDSTPDSLGPDDWYFFALDRTIDRTASGETTTNHDGDRDLVAASETALVISSIDYDITTDAAAGANLRLLAKDALYDGSAPPDWLDLSGITDPFTGAAEILMYPMARNDGSGDFVLVSRSFGCFIVVTWILEDPLGTPRLEGRRVVVPDPPDGCNDTVDGVPQPDDAPPIRLDGFTASGAVTGETVWTAATVGVGHPGGAVSGIGWVEIDMSTWPDPAIAQSGYLIDGASHRFVPAIAASGDGDAAVVFAQSSASEPPSLYTAYRSSDDDVGTFGDPILVAAGTAATFFEPLPFDGGLQVKYADYYGAASDPVDGSLWLIGQTAVEPEDESPPIAVWGVNVVATAGGAPDERNEPDQPSDGATEHEDDTDPGTEADGPRYITGDGITTADVDTARAGIEYAIAEIVAATGYSTRDFDVHVYADTASTAEAWCAHPAGSCGAPATELWSNINATFGPGWIFTRVDGWSENESETFHQEYVRMLHAMLADPVPLVADLTPQRPPGGPQWLIEGAAIYFSSQLALPDVFPFDRQTMIDNALYDDPGRPTLAEIETEDGFRSYPEHSGRWAQTAIYLLIVDYENSPADVMGYFEAVGDGDPWQQAFEETFGVTIADFYSYAESL